MAIDLRAPLPEPNLENERRHPFWQRVHGEALMLERLLQFGDDRIHPEIRPFLINIAKRLDLTAMDIKSHKADSVEPVAS